MAMRISYAPSSSAPVAVPATGTGVPRDRELEAVSSDAIAGLLNPGTNFPDVNRRAAEMAALRGVPGSAAAYGTGLRMTDEERIRRIALGSELLSGAYSRNLPYQITPYQSATLDLQRDQFNQNVLNANAGLPSGSRSPGTRVTMGMPDLGPSWTSSGGVGGGGGRSPSAAAQALGYGGFAYPQDGHGTGAGGDTSSFSPGGTYPDPSGQLLPLYPGGAPVGMDYAPDQYSEPIGPTPSGDFLGTPSYLSNDYLGAVGSEMDFDAALADLLGIGGDTLDTGTALGPVDPYLGPDY